MSLWRNRRKIARAVAGDLRPQAELKLRAHLRVCDACRTHYNLLSQMAAISDPLTVKQRQRARLEALLPGLATAPAPAKRRWVWALPVLVPTLVALLWLRSHVPGSDEQVAWRGGAEPAAWPLSLVLYEFAQGPKGPPVVLGELPFSRGVRVAREALVQFAYAKLRKPTFLYVVGQQDGKAVVLYPRRPQDEQQIVPEPRTKALGTSLNLHAAFNPGVLRLCVVLSTQRLDPAEAAAAVTSGVNGLQVFGETVRLLP